MADVPAKFTCKACGQAYVWKPEFAGRAIKCKCGQVMKVGLEGRWPPEVVVPAVAAATPCSGSIASGYRRVRRRFCRRGVRSRASAAPTPGAGAGGATRPPRTVAAPAITAGRARGGATPVLGYSAKPRQRPINEVEAEVLRKARVTDRLRSDRPDRRRHTGFLPGCLLQGDRKLRIGHRLRRRHVAFESRPHLRVHAHSRVAHQPGAGAGGAGTPEGGRPFHPSGSRRQHRRPLHVWIRHLGAPARCSDYLLLFYLFELDGQEMRIVTLIIWLFCNWGGMMVLFLIAHFLAPNCLG